jgi:DNA-binding MurR/RpiR family transcriptional regulator
MPDPVTLSKTTRNWAKSCPQATLNRAMKALKAAGYDYFRVELRQDGTINLVPGLPTERELAPNVARDAQDVVSERLARMRGG